MKKLIFLIFFAWSINSYSNPRIDIVSNSKYSDTEQIWIAFHDIEWSKNGYSIYKDGKFKFNLKVDEGFVIMRSFEGKYSFASTQAGIGKKLKSCIIQKGWLEASGECDCSAITF